MKSGIYRVRWEVARGFEALPLEYRDMIASSGGIEVRLAAEGIDGYGREVAAVDLLRVSAFDEFAFSIRLNNRIRLGMVRFALNHEIAHVIDVLQICRKLSLGLPLWSEYKAAFKAAGFEGDPQYEDHGIGWLRLFSRLSGMPVDTLKDAVPYHSYIRKTAVAGRGLVGVYCVD